VVVLGSSASAGFGLGAELGAPLSLADILGLALAETGGGVQGFADTTFFLAPEREGREQVEEALGVNPTLVIAVDFPFWYGYGELAGCADRLALLERGLAQLERFTCPVLVGDLPDMTGALEGQSPLLGGGAMLRPGQIPGADCRARLNRRIEDWAAEKANAVVFPLAFFMAELARPGTFEFRGLRFDGASKRGMLQADLLHPTVRGTTTAALFILHHLAEAKWLDGRAVTWDAAALEQRIRKNAAAAKAERSERGHEREQNARRGERGGSSPPRSGGLAELLGLE